MVIKRYALFVEPVGVSRHWEVHGHEADLDYQLEARKRGVETREEMVEDEGMEWQEKIEKLEADATLMMDLWNEKVDRIVKK